MSYLYLILLIFSTSVPLTSSGNHKSKDKFLLVSFRVMDPGLRKTKYNLKTTTLLSSGKSEVMSSIEYGVTPVFSPVIINLKNIGRKSPIRFEIIHATYPQQGVAVAYATVDAVVNKNGKLSFQSGTRPEALNLKLDTVVGPHPVTLLESGRVRFDLHFHDVMTKIQPSDVELTTQTHHDYQILDKLQYPHTDLVRVLGDALDPHTQSFQFLEFDHHGYIFPNELLRFIKRESNQKGLDLHLFLADTGDLLAEGQAKSLNPHALNIILDMGGDEDLSSFNQLGFYVIGCYQHREDDLIQETPEKNYGTGQNSSFGSSRNVGHS